MKAIILAAGYAIRLYPLTKDKPKPLLEVRGKPIIEHIINKLKGIEELKDIFIITNNKFFKHFEKWHKNFSFNKKIKIINDKTESNEYRLGAIGDINFVIEKEGIDDDLLVIAGDNIFEFSLIDVVGIFKKKNRSIIALYDVEDTELAKKYGVVAIDQNNKIVSFEEKPKKPKSTLVSTGVYIYTKDTLSDLGTYAKGHDTDKPGSFLEWLYKRKDVYCFVSKKGWYDIGSVEQLKEARNFFR